MRTRSVACVTIAGTAVLLAGSAHAAAPRIVIFSGEPLVHQVVISDWPAIFRVVALVSPAPVARRAELAGRPGLKVSMFWGPRWIDYLSDGKRASALRPKEADQFGRFYPAWRGRPALIDLGWAGRRPRVVPSKALAILRGFGVPTELRSRVAPPLHITDSWDRTQPTSRVSPRGREVSRAGGRAS